MDASTTRGCLSASKLRRMRAAATKQRMYESCQRSDNLSGINCQLALLTSSFDNLQSLLLGFFGERLFNQQQHSSAFQCWSEPAYGSHYDHSPGPEVCWQDLPNNPAESCAQAAVRACSGDCRDSGPTVNAFATCVHSDKAEEIKASFGSPWQFLLPEECAHASAACKISWMGVAEWTPIGQQFARGSEEETDTVDDTFRYELEEDDLDCEEMEELYQTALKEDPGNVEEKFQHLLEERRRRMAS